METTPASGTCADATMGDVEPFVSRAMKRRWELAAEYYYAMSIYSPCIWMRGRTGKQLLDGI
jgi:hypothetical protein